MVAEAAVAGVAGRRGSAAAACFQCAFRCEEIARARGGKSRASAGRRQAGGIEGRTHGRVATHRATAAGCCAQGVERDDQAACYQTGVLAFDQAAGFDACCQCSA